MPIPIDLARVAGMFRVGRTGSGLRLGNGRFHNPPAADIHKTSENYTQSMIKENLTPVEYVSALEMRAEALISDNAQLQQQLAAAQLELAKWQRDFRDVQDRGEALEKALKAIQRVNCCNYRDEISEAKRIAMEALQ